MKTPGHPISSKVYAIRTMATGVIGMSSLAILGYIARIEVLYSLGGPIGMACTTACCLFLTGISLMLLTLGEGHGH